MISFEVYAVANRSPAELWALVGDFSRLAEWTDADAVEGPPEPPYTVGQRFRTTDQGRGRMWTVITAPQTQDGRGDPYLVEVKTDDIDCGRLGIGIRVAHDPLGARLILAGLLDPLSKGEAATSWTGRRKTTAGRLVHMPRIRSRFDRWTARAVSAKRA